MNHFQKKEQIHINQKKQLNPCEICCNYEEEWVFGKFLILEGTLTVFLIS